LGIFSFAYSYADQASGEKRTVIFSTERAEFSAAWRIASGAGAS
jgi:5-keto 4-deoxyuronate isomerase